MGGQRRGGQQERATAEHYGTIPNNPAGSAVGQAFFEFIYNFEGGKPFESMYPGTEDAYADMTPLFSSPQGIAVVELIKASCRTSRTVP